jgi:perosamine synthetase
MVTTNDEALARLLRRLRDHAFSPERHFWHEYVGFNYRMTNLQAAVGLAQTERLPAIVAQRRQLRELYHARLRSIPGLRLPDEAPGARSVFWMYALQVGPEFGCGRDELREQLARRGIETRTFFVPMHVQPIYFAEYRGERFPVAEALCRRGLYLPTSENLTEPDVDWICGQIAEISAQAAESTLRAAE